MALTSVGGTYGALQPLLHHPMGPLERVAVIAPTTVPEGMTPAALLMRDVLPFTEVQAPTSPGVVIFGASRWADSAMDAAEVRTEFSAFYDGARISFVDGEGTVTIDAEAPRTVVPGGIRSALGRCAAGSPVRLITVFLSDETDTQHWKDLDLLRQVTQCGAPGALVRVVAPGTAVRWMSAYWSELPLVAREGRAHFFFVAPPGASAGEMKPISIFLGTIDPAAWLYDEFLERSLLSEEPELQLAIVEAMDILHDPRFRDQARAIAADYGFDPEVRMAALAAIAHYRDPGDVSFLLDRMGHERAAKVAAVAATAVGELGDSRAIPRLEAAKAGDESPIVRGAAHAAWTRLKQQQPGADDRTNVYAPEMSAHWSYLDALETVASLSADPRDRARQALALQVWSGAR